MLRMKDIINGLCTEITAVLCYTAMLFFMIYLLEVVR